MVVRSEHKETEEFWQERRAEERKKQREEAEELRLRSLTPEQHQKEQEQRRRDVHRANINVVALIMLLVPSFLLGWLVPDADGAFNGLLVGFYFLLVLFWVAAHTLA